MAHHRVGIGRDLAVALLRHRSSPQRGHCRHYLRLQVRALEHDPAPFLSSRAPIERPEGLVYRPDVISPAEESQLLARIDELRWHAIVIHGQAARRTARHFGLGYDYEARTPQPGDPIPDWLEPARSRAAELAGHEPEELIEILVQRYPPGATIGWHRDAPAFGTVVGISLAGVARLRFQRGKGERRRVFEVALEPRSGYVLGGEARRSWQHSIPATKELRYSITFRTLMSR